ncbi:MAG: CPBP family glutamic-type intramembrane protease [Candidatus Cohnella colombiensis]|uniref:CPBP family glutamic-type intramembrane protease n=1 Tax=Candidatus Cohnella colombiensis TaxID=3121368 RepID=A0AA95EX48_9BACL|nr:MAG: CPBP family glutamic-type intramembrane protease [Cohnella sp.]
MKVIDKKTLSNIIVFSLIVLSCGWIGRLVDLKATTDASGSLGQLIWIVSPLLAMVILRTFRGDGWKDLGIKPKIKNNIFLYLISIVFLPISALIIVLVGHNFKLMDASNLSPAFLTVFAAALLPSFIKNIFEEFAWRGYLTPKLFSLGYNRLLIHIYVGVIWSAWHIPYLLIQTDTTEGMITFIPRVMIGLIVQSIVYGEIRLRTNSVWPAVIMHTIGNAFVDSLILHKYLNIQTEFNYLVTPSPEGVLAILIAAITGIWLYKKRGSKL